MSRFKLIFLRFLSLYLRIVPRAKGIILGGLYSLPIRRCGRAVTLRGMERVSGCVDLSIGDFCWIETIKRYKSEEFHPQLIIGDRVALSSFVHISCLGRIVIGQGVLIGSKVFIGDHNHGSIPDFNEYKLLDPADRPLRDQSDIYIGDRVWLCDGVVVLAGSNIAAGSIIGANSVVKISIDRPAIIAGNPAKIIRYL